MFCIADIFTILDRTNALNLIWMPGHEGIQGNEETDRLAGRDTRQIRVKLRKGPLL